MLTRENMGLTSIEKPMRPGIKKSTYWVCSVLTVVEVMLIIGMAFEL